MNSDMDSSQGGGENHKQDTVEHDNRGDDDRRGDNGNNDIGEIHPDEGEECVERFQSNYVSKSSEIVRPHSDLPRPEPPPGVLNRSVSSPAAFENPAASIGKFVREKSSSISAAIARRISSLAKDDCVEDDGVIREFDLVGLKVIKTPKEEERRELKGRISFFSRSNCRDCGAVRSFLREGNFNFVEINVDVYTGREKELVERTGGATVPQIFFNEKRIGGLVALNSLRNSGMLDAKLEEILGRKCPDDAPAPPVYGFDEAEDLPAEEEDDISAVVRVARQRVPIQDRIVKMKFVKNCFSGAELVEALINHLDCGRRKAIEIGKELAGKHFIHHVNGENDFADGNHYYRFLEHEPFIPKCHNFRGVVNDSKPKSVAALSRRLFCIMSAILESYASNDRRHLNFIAISNSEEFRRYVNLVEDLQRVDLTTLSDNEKMAFFLNLHNAMAIHAVISIGPPGGMMDRMAFFSEFMYVVGGHPYSLSSIRNGILRGNRRPPLFLVKPFSSSDKRLELAFEKVNPLIHFGIWNASRGSPSVRFFTPQCIDSELRNATREYLQRDDGMKVDLAKRTVYLPKIIKWYKVDFGQEQEILKWIIHFLDPSQTGLLTHLLSDGCSVNIVYQNYDWSLNS